MSALPFPPSDEAGEDPLAATAAAWLIKRDRGFTAAEQDDFSQWLAADPRHRAAFARQQNTWREFDLLADWRPEHGAVPNPDLLARPRRSTGRSRWTLGLAAAACLAGGLLLWPPLARLTDDAPPATLATATPADAYQRRELTDGSTIELRGASEVQVDYTPTERRVLLVRGEAFFNVAKDPARPFIVATRGVHVRAVGTAFNVRLAAAEVEVLVTGGKVQLVPTSEALAPLDAPTAAPPPPPPAPTPTLLAAGSRARVPLPGDESLRPAPRVEAVSAAEIDRALDWHPHLLDFDSTPLAEVVRQFNRRNRTQLVLASPALGRLPIVASVQSHNVEGFVRLLERTAGLKAQRQGDCITLRAGE